MIKSAMFLMSILLLFSCTKDAKIAGNNNNITDTTGTTTPPVKTVDTLNFSGYSWTIKNSGIGTMGPGPNNWNPANAYVDSVGYLHLKITKANGKWYCAEVQTTQKFDYGKYQFWVDGPIDKLDDNVILGLFNYSGTDGIDEMDIEYGTFGGQRTNSGFTVYPSAAVGGLQWHSGFNTTLTGTATTQRFTRVSDKSVLFEEINGYHDDDSNIIDSVSCRNPPNSISQVAMPVYINLWLDKGNAPVNGLPAEIVIRSFRFTPQ